MSYLNKITKLDFTFQPINSQPNGVPNEIIKKLFKYNRVEPPSPCLTKVISNKPEIVHKANVTDVT